MKEFLTAKIMKQLHEVKPSLRFRYACRDRINTHIRMHHNTSVAHTMLSGERFKLIGLYFQRAIISTIARSALVACVVLFTGGVFWVNAEDALPGDVLYNIKIIKEKVSLIVETSPEGEAQLRLKYAGKRIAEVEQLAARNSDTHSDSIIISKTVATAKAELVSAKGLLDVFKQDSSSTTQKKSDYLNLTRTIQNTAVHASEALKNITLKNIDNTQNNVIRDVRQDLDTLAFSVFKDIVANYETGNISSDMVTKEDIITRLNEVLAETVDMYTKHIKKDVVLGQEFGYIDSFEERVRYMNLLEEQRHYRQLDQRILADSEHIAELIKTEKLSEAVGEIDKLRALIDSEKLRKQLDATGAEIK